MSNTLEELKKITKIHSVRKVALTLDIKEKIGVPFVKVAQTNEKHVNVFVYQYESNGNLVSGFLIEPKLKKGKLEKLPVIFFNRGGNRDFGIVRIGSFFLALAEMARWGYIVIGSQYSGNVLSEGVDQFGGEELADIENLYPILKKLSRADTKRIGMYGGSRGGMMTYLMLKKVPWIRAAVTVAGVANLSRSEKLRPEMKKVHREIMGARTGFASALKARSAVFWADKFPKKVPLLMMHGSADWRVSPLDSIELSQKLYEQKVPFRFVLFEGGDHSLTEFRKERMSLTKEWFDKYVMRLEKLPNLKPHGD